MFFENNLQWNVLNYTCSCPLKTTTLTYQEGLTGFIAFIQAPTVFL